MNYGEARDLALHLIHQESIAGTRIPGTYNNQQDYLDKIPGLINAAQMDLATTSKKIPASVMLGELTYTEMSHSRIYTLPKDMWQRRGSGILVPAPREYRAQGQMYRRFNQCKDLGRDRIVLPTNLPEDSILEYWRYPTRLSLKPADTDELDNVPEAQEAVPYYVAAHLVIWDDAFLYASFYNEYEEKKMQMIELPTTEPSVVEDVFFFGGGLYGGW